MKKALILPILSALVVVLNSCISSEFVNLSSFIYNWNNIGESKISYSDFTVEHNKNENIYNWIDADILLRLISDENNNINEVRVVLSKRDSNGKGKKINDELTDSFLRITSLAITSFCNIEINEANNLLNNFELSSDIISGSEGELKINKDFFNLKYYSDSLVSEFIIINTHLKEIESTLKPESKIAFADTTETRIETVPHK